MGQRVWILLLVLSAVILWVQAWPRTALFGYETGGQDDEETFLKRVRRQSDRTPTTQRQSKYLLSILNQLMNDLSLEICEGDITKGVQCLEENLCVPWEGICDGDQVCGLETRAGCLNSSSVTYGVPQERLCNGDENEDWCVLPQYVPKTCGEKVEVPKGGKATVYSPYFPGSYLGDIKCEWSIQAPQGTRLSVNVKSFESEENYDFMNIGPGKMEEDDSNYYIFKHSGQAPPSTPAFSTPDSNLFLTFQTDMWVTYKGFEVEFADVDAYDPGVDINDVLDDGAVNNTCGGEITLKSDEEETITSPQYPQNYPNNYQCDWIISIEGGQRVGVSFETLDLEPDADFLDIGTGSSPGAPTIRLTANKRPEEAVMLDSSTIWMRLKTDRSINRLGFKAKVREQPYNECGGNVPIRRDGSAVVASPQFPDVGYHLNHNCLWNIKGDPERGLTAVFKDFNTEKQWDTVSVGFGPEPARDGSNYVIENWSGDALPEPAEFTTDENEMWIHFKTDGTVIDRGWKVQIFDSNIMSSNTTVEEKARVKPDRDCGGTVRFDPSMGKAVITSPDYPNKYRPILDCQWFIDIPYEGNVLLHFEQFNTEKHRDVVSVGTGSNPDDESTALINMHSGTKKPEDVTTDQKKLWVRFLTDFQTELNGWKLDIISVPTQDCGGYIMVPSNASISIASPGYPYRYEGNQKCIYTLVGPNNRRLRVSVADFESELYGGVLSIGEGCRKKDFGSSVIVDQHSGFVRPLYDAFIPRTNVVWIRWVTEYDRPYKGWKIVASDTGLVGELPQEEDGTPIPCNPPGPTTPATTTAGPTPGPTEASGSGYPDWYEDGPGNEVPVEPEVPDFIPGTDYSV
ncbi:CUB and sushi domain-containing protein 3-like [Acanthaster planci]|uniref:CUB and sushi domain-containing protein 3-like n=1 Tax=Acanthaster planci TaxID=133434 RepID=A0A8B7Y2S9_ACAPL|nr:CUB and sushi domain-containing protein 3-like [Acanthaster planci]